MRFPRVTALTLTLTLAGLVGACGTSGGDDADSKGTTSTTADKGSATSEGRRTPTSPKTATPKDQKTPTTVARSADAEAYLTALSDKMKTSLFTPSGATCMAGGYLDAIGVDTLKAAGISPADFAESDGNDLAGKVTLTEAMGNQVYERYATCGVDVAAIFRELYTGENPTPEQNACLDAQLTDSNLRRSFVADYLGQDLDPDPLDEAEKCTMKTGN